jgi:hypothetical protein
MLCSPLKVNRRFEGTCRFHLHGRRRSQETSVESVLNFNGLHGVISQNVELFITTAVSISNPTNSITVQIKTQILNSCCEFYMHWNGNFHYTLFCKRSAQVTADSFGLLLFRSLLTFIHCMGKYGNMSDIPRLKDSTKSSRRAPGDFVGAGGVGLQHPRDSETV